MAFRIPPSADRIIKNSTTRAIRHRTDSIPFGTKRFQRISSEMGPIFFEAGPMSFLVSSFPQDCSNRHVSLAQLNQFCFLPPHICEKNIKSISIKVG
jgi:hypothetical protein